MPCMETLLSTNIKTNLFLQILMNAAEKNRLVEKWQCVKIPWDHTSVFARKVLPLMTNKKSVMVSVIHWFIKNAAEKIPQITTIGLFIVVCSVTAFERQRGWR